MALNFAHLEWLGMSLESIARKPAVILAEAATERSSLHQQIKEVLFEPYELREAAKLDDVVRICGQGENGVIFVRDLGAGMALLEQPLDSRTSVILIIDDQDEDAVHAALVKGAHDYLLRSQCSPPALKAAWKRAAARSAAGQLANHHSSEFQKAAMQLAHDLKQPVQSVSFYLHAIRLNLGNPKANLDQLIAEALVEVGRFNEIIHQRLMLVPK